MQLLYQSDRASGDIIRQIAPYECGECADAPDPKTSSALESGSWERSSEAATATASVARPLSRS